jgi:hypothetical protein
VAEVLLITFQRPASMTKSEMSAVLRERGRAAPIASGPGGWALRVVLSCSESRFASAGELRPRTSPRT